MLGRPGPASKAEDGRGPACSERSGNLQSGGELSHVAPGASRGLAWLLGFGIGTRISWKHRGRSFESSAA